MKFKTTQKAIRNGYFYIINIGYCSAQNLLNGREPIAYTSGVYGWNADVYQIYDNVCICTGYRPFGNISPDYETLQKYDTAAEKIFHAPYNGNYNYEERRAKVDSLLKEFVDTLVKDNRERLLSK